MITEKEYSIALEIVKQYEKEQKRVSKKHITYDEMKAFCDNFLDDNMIMRYTDLLSSVMLNLGVGRTYAVSIVATLRENKLIYQDGLRGLYLK